VTPTISASGQKLPLFITYKSGKNGEPSKKIQDNFPNDHAKYVATENGWQTTDVS
jgi:hypothetical protein